MKYILPFLLVLSVHTLAQNGQETTRHFEIPDTLKAAQFLTEISISTDQDGWYGSSFRKAGLMLAKTRKVRQILFKINYGAGIPTLVAQGLNTHVIRRPVKKGEVGMLQGVAWSCEWQKGQQYKLLVTALTDSASHSSFYTGYIYLPETKKWKLLASFKYADTASFIKNPSITIQQGNKKSSVSKDITVHEAWVQRNNGSWKTLLAEASAKTPVVAVTDHADSTSQAALDKKAILDSTKGLFSVTNDVYYTVTKEGTGEFVKLTDTVKVYYKGWLLKDGTVFDQTKDKPATFPLARLIKGWQLGVVNCRVGGKIKMIMPSGLAYSIRSRSKDIPPNSVLVFEVEVVEAKAAR